MAGAKKNSIAHRAYRFYPAITMDRFPCNLAS
jgi:hypothetical protein